MPYREEPEKLEMANGNEVPCSNGMAGLLM